MGRLISNIFALMQSLDSLYVYLSLFMEFLPPVGRGGNNVIMQYSGDNDDDDDDSRKQPRQHGGNGVVDIGPTDSQTTSSAATTYQRI